VIDKLPGFRRRMEWFMQNRPDLCGNIASLSREGMESRRLLSLVAPSRLIRVLERMLSEAEFLSPHGIRALSKYHQQQPFILPVDGQEYRVDYEPAESNTGLFGGNSNWRGPVWFPLNYLVVQSLRTLAREYGDRLRVEHPTGSGRTHTLAEVADDLSDRLVRLFCDDEQGRRPVFGDCELFQNDPAWHDLLSFHEYFHGDTGKGLGAAHQTGWTALVANLILQRQQPTLPGQRTAVEDTQAARQTAATRS
jgi:hypothetical protein